MAREPPDGAGKDRTRAGGRGLPGIPARSPQISGLHIRSRELGLYGRLDVLELDLTDKEGPDNALAFGLKGEWSFYPVEFKHGTPKEGDRDRVQVCAQALCLEEMLNVGIAEASL